MEKERAVIVEHSKGQDRISSELSDFPERAQICSRCEPEHIPHPCDSGGTISPARAARVFTGATMGKPALGP